MTVDRRPPSAAVFALACVVNLAYELGAALRRWAPRATRAAAAAAAATGRALRHAVRAWADPAGLAAGDAIVAGAGRLARLLDERGPVWRDRGRQVATTAGRRAVVAGRALARTGAAAARRSAPGVAVVARVVPGVLVAAWFAVDPVLRTAALVAYDEAGRLPALEQRSVLVAADGTPLGEVPGALNRREVALHEVPRVVRDLIVVAEDRRFWDHGGYDLRAIGRAAVANVRAGEVAEGASTITQQLAKQNLVGDDRTVGRKLRELVYAVALERRFTKEELLERYLNQVYFGSGAYGIVAAADELFGVAPADLDRPQAALLAGLIRSPEAVDPRRDPEAALRRRSAVITDAVDAGVLSPAEGDRARAAPLGVVDDRPPDRPAAALVAAVRREVLALPLPGTTRAERAALLERGGLRVETTIDPRLQAAAQRSAAAHADGGAAVAVAAVDPSSGAVRALHTHAPDHPALDLAAGGRRQPGSLFKPFTAVAALDAGLAPGAALCGRSPATFDLGGERWEVTNFGGRSRGPVDLGEALGDSVNTAFAQLGVAVGSDAVAGVLGALGVPVEQALGPPVERGPAVALGGVRHGVSPLEMAAAYGTFVTEGRHAPPALVSRVVDARGRQLHRAAPRLEPAIDPGTAGEVGALLAGVVADGTGQAARLPGWTVVGKTGTSQDQADAWFAGAVPGLSAAVWVGHPEARVPMPHATGATVAAPAWRAFMGEALDGVAPRPPPAPPADLAAEPAPGLDLPPCRDG